MNGKTQDSSAGVCEGSDDDAGNYVAVAGELLDCGRYRVQHAAGHGSFGHVVVANDLASNQLVAIKIIRNNELCLKQGESEVSVLEMLNCCDTSDGNGIVKCFGHFSHKNHLCIVFELMSFNLYELLSMSGFHGVSLNLVRRFAQQLLKTLEFLRRPDVGIVHCDLKPENVVLRSASSAVIKVIDFGSSFLSAETEQAVFKYVQSRFYRSPEVILGLPYSYPVDMWSLGCVLAEMFTGNPLFCGSCELDQLVKIAEIIGMPPSSLIEKRTKHMKAFVRTPTGFKFIASLHMKPRSKLLGIISSCVHPFEGTNDHAERESFVDLLHKMFEYDPSKRITPSQALSHPFISGVSSVSLKAPFESAKAESISCAAVSLATSSSPANGRVLT